MFARFLRRQPAAPAASPPAWAAARAQKWTRGLLWLAWLLPIAISLSIYAFVWYSLTRGGGDAAGLERANSLLLYGVVGSTLVGIFIYQVQLILRQQVAASAELERRVDERTRHLTQALEQLDRQNRELMALDRQKSEFVTLVSHELRAPLTNINSGLELLLSREDGLPPRSRDSLRLVAAEGQRLTHFVETILDISALEAGQLPLAVGPASLAAAVQRAVEQVAPALPAGRLEVDLPANLPPAQGDERYLQSVVFHLVDNALKYAPEGPVTVAASAAPDGWLEVRVADCGPGLPPEAAARLFQRFERLNARDSQAVYGHGLGLYMCRRIVEACGGSIRAENLPERGAVFIVRLPAWAEAR